ncbi:MAG TPA: YceI family protein [Rhizomicrobium sp.]|nr:YceI family protein [Rhizomicrobium sp.]
MRAAAAFLLPLIAALPAWAAPWNVDYAKSRLGFTVQWSNEPFSAVFRRWNADIDFDPNDLAHAHATVTVDLASEASDEPDFDSGLKGAQGFETAQFPTARFATTNFVRKSANAYEARGTLNIRGITRDITLPFTLAIDGRAAHMIGTAHVLRTDFGLGQGEWAAPAPVAHDVAITIDLFATQ